MAVVAGQYIYDVGDPVHPRLVCRTANTSIHLLDGKAIAYTTVIAGQVVVVRRDLTTGSESQTAKLPADPLGSKSWTSDGSLGVYVTAGASGANGRWPVQVHLWSSGADHVLYTFDAGPGDLSSRWSALPIVEFSPDHAYMAISDSICCIASYEVRIFSVADRRQLLVTGTQGIHARGGTWIANNHFVWAAGSGSVMQWTPIAGATLLRSELWHGPTTTSDGRWLAGTLLTDMSKPRVLIVPVGGGGTLTTGLGSGPAFVTPMVVWYAQEGPSPDPVMDPTWPNGTVRAFDVTNGSDQLVQFRVGEAPDPGGFAFCCTTRI